MQALILAGGFGSRLMPVINDRPKVMAPLHGRPFLEYILINLKQQGITDIILALGYLSSYIQDYFGNGKGLGIKIKYSIENIPLGTGGALKNAEKLLTDTVLVINGDTYLDVDFQQLYDFHISKKAEVTITLTTNHHSLGRGVVGLDKNGKIISFKESEDKEDIVGNYTNAGVYVMNKTVIRYIKRGEKVSLEKETFPALLKNKKNIYGFIVANDFIDIGTPERYKMACEKLKLNF